MSDQRCFLSPWLQAKPITPGWPRSGPSQRTRAFSFGSISFVYLLLVFISFSFSFFYLLLILLCIYLLLLSPSCIYLLLILLCIHLLLILICIHLLFIILCVYLLLILLCIYLLIIFRCIYLILILLCIYLLLILLWNEPSRDYSRSGSPTYSRSHSCHNSFSNDFLLFFPFPISGPRPSGPERAGGDSSLSPSHHYGPIQSEMAAVELHFYNHFH